MYNLNLYLFGMPSLKYHLMQMWSLYWKELCKSEMMKKFLLAEPHQLQS